MSYLIRFLSFPFVLYIETIKKLNEKADIYSSQLEKVKEKIDISQLDMNTSF
jgi:hypothetical protein